MTAKELVFGIRKEDHTQEDLDVFQILPNGMLNRVGHVWCTPYDGGNEYWVNSDLRNRVNVAGAVYISPYYDTREEVMDLLRKVGKSLEY